MNEPENEVCKEEKQNTSPIAEVAASRLEMHQILTISREGKEGPAELNACLKAKTEERAAWATFAHPL